MHCLGFSEPTIHWFRSYLTNRLFSVNLGNEFSSSGKLPCGVPQGSVFGPFLFLLHVNDMPQAVSCEFLLYADDTCLICMGNDIKTIEDQLNRDFSLLCEWFINDKLSIHLGEQKTKSILFGTTKRLKDSRNLYIRYKDIEIKQYSKVTYLVHVPTFRGVSGSEDRGGGDNSIQFINIGREGDKSFKEWRRKIGGWKGG